MKVLNIITLAIVIIAIICGVLYFQSKDPVTKKDFFEFVNTTGLNFDTIKKAVEIIDFDLDTIKSNIKKNTKELKKISSDTDTLKAGQEMIFETMNENIGNQFIIKF